MNCFWIFLFRYMLSLKGFSPLWWLSAILLVITFGGRTASNSSDSWQSAQSERRKRVRIQYEDSKSTEIQIQRTQTFSFFKGKWKVANNYLIDIMVFGKFLLDCRKNCTLSSTREWLLEMYIDHRDSMISNLQIRKKMKLTIAIQFIA